LAIKHVGIFILYPITPPPQQEAHLPDKIQKVYPRKIHNTWKRKCAYKKKITLSKNGI